MRSVLEERIENPQSLIQETLCILRSVLSVVGSTCFPIQDLLRFCPVPGSGLRFDKITNYTHKESLINMIYFHCIYVTHIPGMWHSGSALASHSCDCMRSWVQSPTCPFFGGWRRRVTSDWTGPSFPVCPARLQYVPKTLTGGHG